MAFQSDVSASQEQALASKIQVKTKQDLEIYELALQNAVLSMCNGDSQKAQENAAFFLRNAALRIKLKKLLI